MLNVQKNRNRRFDLLMPTKCGKCDKRKQIKKKKKANKKSQQQQRNKNQNVVMLISINVVIHVFTVKGKSMSLVLKEQTPMAKQNVCTITAERTKSFACIKTNRFMFIHPISNKVTPSAI